VNGSCVIPIRRCQGLFIYVDISSGGYYPAFSI
jgi:hypothetical protein